MELSEAEREITKDVVLRFLRENKPSSRRYLARTFRSSQAFHRLTGSGILATTNATAPTTDEEYLPKALAFYYGGNPDALRAARDSVNVVTHALMHLNDDESDKKDFTFEDLTLAANKVSNRQLKPETLKLGLYLVRDLGFLTVCPGDRTQLGPFQIAEHIVEIPDVNKVWDDFIARSTANYEPRPLVPFSETGEDDGDILMGSEGLEQMAKTRRDVTPTAHQPTISHELALKRLQKFLAQIPEVRAAGHDSPMISTWTGNVKIVLGDFYGENSIVSREFLTIRFSPGVYYDGQPDSDFIKRYNEGLDKAEAFLKSRINDLSEGIEQSPARSYSRPATGSDSRRIFVVHGHHDGNKETVARFLTKLGLEPVILHEQADQGKTVIEKFEAHAAEVRCAVVILTADDVAYAKSDPDKKESRARQNVILELGYFVGKLGRAQTVALVEKDVTLPSDIHGLVYIQLEDGHWRLRLVRELKAAGLEVDANRAF